MTSALANSYVVATLWLALKSVCDVLAMLGYCAFFFVATTTMLFTRRLTPRVGLCRFIMGMIMRRRPQGV
jgi:hypothetical protein